MWEALNNANVLLAIIASCVAIGTAIVGIIRFIKGHSQPQPAHSQNRPASSAHIGKAKSETEFLYGLDFWEKAEVIGQGAFEGLINGAFAFFIAFAVLIVILLAIFIISNISNIAEIFRPTNLHTFGIEAIISGVGGFIVGSMVGTVSGVNETKEKADSKKRYKSLFVAKSTDARDTEPDLPKAPLLKPTGNPSIDRVYDTFQKQIESNSKQPWGGLTGALIVFAESDQYGEIVNLIDYQSWLNSRGRSYTLFNTKYHTYIRSHPVYNHVVYAAVFKDLHFNGLYVLWSDKKQPALVAISSTEIIAVNWH